jgi:hypothetical protein
MRGRPVLKTATGQRTWARWIARCRHSSVGWNQWPLSRTLIGISDRPGQLLESAMSTLFRQAYRAWSGQGDRIEYLTVPF